MATQSTQKLCIEAIYDDLLTLIPGTISGTFDGVALTDADVYKLRLVTSRIPPLTRYPAIVVGAPLDEGETMEGGTNASEYVGYPVFVGIFAPGNDLLTLNDDFDLIMHWRAQIRRRYHNRVPIQAAVSTLRICRVEPRQIVDSQEWDANRLSTALLIRCECEDLPVT